MRQRRRAAIGRAIARASAITTRSGKLDITFRDVTFFQSPNGQLTDDSHLRARGHNAGVQQDVDAPPHNPLLQEKSTPLEIVRAAISIRLVRLNQSMLRQFADERSELMLHPR